MKMLRNLVIVLSSAIGLAACNSTGAYYPHHTRTVATVGLHFNSGGYTSRPHYYRPQRPHRYRPHGYNRHPSVYHQPSRPHRPHRPCRPHHKHGGC